MKTNLQTQIEKLRNEIDMLSRNGINGILCYINKGTVVQMIYSNDTMYRLVTGQQSIREMEKRETKIEKLKVKIREEKLKELGI
jgi:ribosomal protein L9